MIQKSTGEITPSFANNQCKSGEKHKGHNLKFKLRTLSSPINQIGRNTNLELTV